MDSVSFNFAPYLEILPVVALAFFLGLLLTPILRHLGLKYGFATKPKMPEPQSTTSKNRKQNIGLRNSNKNPNNTTNESGAKHADVQLYEQTKERGEETKIHKKTTSRLGELAMVIPILLFTGFYINFNIQSVGIICSIIFVTIMGVIDSKYHLNEFVKLFGLTISGFILFTTGTVVDVQSIIDLSRIDYYFNNPVTNEAVSVLSLFVTVGWFYIIPFAVSNVGGVDGLAEGTSAIAILILLLIGIRTGNEVTIYIGALALGGLLGLLPYNFHPAVIFSEHLIYGFLIAILAVTSSTKIATSVLLLTVPIIDTMYLFYIRTKRYNRERGSKPFNIFKMLSYWGTGDKNHFHHKLMFLGNNPIRIAMIMYAMYGILGFLALIVTGLYLTLAILGSLVVVVLIFVLVNKALHKTKKEGV